MPKRIEKLTQEQENMFPVWRDKWIEIGLRTGAADWETFDRYMPVCYEKADIPYPKKIIKVSSPIVGALASSIALNLLKQKRSDAVGGAVDDAVGVAVRDAVGVAVRDAVRGAVGDAVDDAVGVAVRGAVGGAVGVAVGVAVRAAVGGAVDVAVGDAVRDAVDGAVGGAVGGAVRGAVDGAVGGARKKTSLKWTDWLGGQFWVGGYYWGSPAAVSFYTDICGLELAPDTSERATAYRKVCESVNYIWPCRDFIMVCERPIRISRNVDGQLDYDQGKAIEYPDGWGLFMLGGVGFDDEKLYWKVVSGKMSFKEIVEIDNTEQQLQALRFNPNAIISEGAKMISKSERGNELLLIEGKEINKVYDEPKVWFLRYSDPSKPAPNNIFYDGVDPALAAKTQDPDTIMAVHCGLLGEEYSGMRIEH